MSEEILLPPRMFAAGDEPIGERVNSYHKIKRTELLIDALEPEELEFLRQSTFSKVLSIDENPPFSGAFGQYVVVRLLKVNKKYEIWFLFAGNPVRMSLREFAIVTDLNCGKVPCPSKKKKNPLKQKLYWNELMGSLKSCTVDTAIDMLKKRVVKTKEARIKFACLAITSSILFPSSHNPRINPEHVELIRDLDEFLAFPWGRVSFQTLVTSLISKDETALSQSSVALRGYVDAIQLVLLAAVPDLKEEITLSDPIVIEDSDSDSETSNEGRASEEDDNALPPGKPSPPAKYCLIPGHAKNIDNDCKVMVKSILEEPYEEWSAGLDFEWVDELEDAAVSNMIRLIEEGFSFQKEMFKGGLNSIDLSRLRGDKNQKEKEPKATDVELSDSRAHITLANLVVTQLGEKLLDPTSAIRDGISSIESRIHQALDAKIEKLVASALQSQLPPIIESTITRSMQDIDKKIANALLVQIKSMQTAVLDGLIAEFRPPTHRRDASVEVTLSGETSLPVPLTDLTAPSVVPSEAAGSDMNTLSAYTDGCITAVLRDLNPEVHTSLPAKKDVATQARSLPLSPAIGNTNISLSNQPIILGVSNPPSDMSVVPADENAILPHVNLAVKHLTGQVTGETVAAQDMEGEERTSQEVEMEGVEQNAGVNKVHSEEDVPTMEETDNSLNDVSRPVDNDEEVLHLRKSKRARIIPSVFQDYRCDPKVTAGFSIIPDLGHRFSVIEHNVMQQQVIMLPNDYALNPSEFLNIAYRTSIVPTGVVDALLGFVSRGTGVGPNVAILDTSLPVSIMNHHSRFVKTAVKDRCRLKFPEVPLTQALELQPERIYFPFNMDRQHWVGVCIDLKGSTLHVLDSNTSLRSDSLLKKELNPIANLIPYVLMQLGFLETNANLKAFNVSRCKGMPQISSQPDAAIMTVLLIEAHASDGPIACKAISPRLLPDASKQLAVNFFEYISK